MSVLVDPPLLMAKGRAYARVFPEAAQGPRATAPAGALAIGVFWTAAAAFWLDHPATVPLRRALGYRSGREFMLRFPLPDRGRRRRSRRSGREEAIAAAAFASYPLWLWLGWDSGRRARPRGS
jgi:hypothetical protein